MSGDHACPTFATVAVLAALVLAGCGPGAVRLDLQVPQERFRQIDAMRMEQLAVPARPATAPAVPAELSLSIEECRRIALENNLDLKVELLAPTIAREAISEERARFESLFTADLSYAKTDTPTATTLAGSQVETVRLNPGVQVPLSTGGALRFDAPMERLQTNNVFSTLNPAYSSDLAASISHPLLRGAGKDVNTNRIRIATYQSQQTEARTKLQVIRVLANLDRAYWRLDAARRFLEVRKKEYDLAVAQLERAQRQVRAGAAAEVEIVRAEAGVADRLEAIILAENQVRDRQRELKRILNMPGLELGGATVIVPTSRPNPVRYVVDPSRLVDAAVAQRMEMLELELQLASQSADVRAARNGLLPLVSLDYTYNINGLGASFDDSLEMLAHKDFEDHRLGLRVEVPLGNQAAQSRLRRSLAVRLQTLATREQRRLQIEQEVLAAADQLEANWQRILAAQGRVVLAARVLDVETRQFELGLRTSTDVLDAQTRLADAQSAEIAALTEYQIAQVDIAYAMGMILGASHVEWAPAPAPQR